MVKDKVGFFLGDGVDFALTHI